ncbi:MAG: ABC transporter transmembrane domain-containing protein, partial [Leptolyngbyaceae cyanobacterium]
MPKKQSSDSLITDLLRLFRHLPRRRRFQLLVLLVLLVANSLSEMVSVGAIVPFLSVLGNAQGTLQSPRWQPLLGQLQIQTPQQLVWATALGIIAVVGINSGVRLLILHFQGRLMAAISTEISCQVYKVVLYQPYSFHVQQNSSDLLQTTSRDVYEVSTLVGVLMTFAQYILTAPALISALLLIDWKIVCSLSLVLGTTYTILFNQRKRLLHRNGTLMAEANQQRIKVVQEGAGGIRDILLDNSQSFFERVYRQNTRILARLGTANGIIIGSPGIVIEFVAMTAIALLTLTMGQGGDFSRAVPVLGGLTLGVKRLLPTLQGLFGNLGTFQTLRAPLSRVLVALERPVDPLMLRPAPPPQGLERNLQLEGVWFRYSADNDWVLRGLDLTIAARTTVAFVGSTGSGKSTTA